MNTDKDAFSQGDADRNVADHPSNAPLPKNERQAPITEQRGRCAR